MCLSDVPFQPMNPVLNWNAKDKRSMKTILFIMIIMKRR